MIITIEKNIVTGRFHPFVWRYAPAPSSELSEPIQRYKSKMHHTAGFDTEQEARESIPGLVNVVRAHYGEACLRTEHVGQMTWQPGEVPAAVRWMEVESPTRDDDPKPHDPEQCQDRQCGAG